MRNVVRSDKNVRPSFIQTILSSFFSLSPMNVTEIKVTNKCVDSCPESFKGKSVTVNEATRQCVVQESDIEAIMDTPTMDNSGSVFENVTKLKIKYDESITNAKAEFMANRVADKSDKCSYRGSLKKRERGDYDSYFFCRCNEGYTGDNCQIPLNLAHDYQNLLAEALDTLNNQITSNSQQSRKIFLESLFVMNKFKTSLPLMEKMASVIQIHLKQDKVIENRKKLYNLFDAILLNLFDLMDDQKRLPLDVYETSSEIKQESDAIYDTVNLVIREIENAFEDLRYTHSFLEYDMKHYIGLDTYSYIMAEYRLSSYNKDRGYSISNPNIDMSTYTKFASNWIFVTFVDKDNTKNNIYHLQALNFSSTLFEYKMNPLNITFLSNLLYLRLIDPDNPHVNVEASDAGVYSFSLKFALLFVPAYEDLGKYLACRAYNFEKNDYLAGNLEKFIDPFEDESDDENNENAYAVCNFRALFSLKSYYFSVVMRKDV